jgi:hypothetical protein
MDKKQEEKIRFLMKTFKTLVTLALALNGGLVYLSRDIFLEKGNTNVVAMEKTLLILGTVFDICILIIIFVLWFEIRKIIKDL